MAGWEDYSIDGTSFGKRFPGVVLHAFIYALHEKFLAIPVNFNPSLTPSTWRKTIQIEINRVLPYYVPYYEDEKRVQEWQDFLELHGFLDNKTEKQIQEFLENLCNTGILEVTPPGIFLASYAKMFYDLLNLMTGIRADKIASKFKINCHSDWINHEGETSSEDWNDQPFNSGYFYRFDSAQYCMYRYPYMSSENLDTKWNTRSYSNIQLKFSNPTYSSRTRKFSYIITGFFAGKDKYTKTKSIRGSGYKYPYHDGYHKYESDYSICSNTNIIHGLCAFDKSEVLVPTGLSFNGELRNEDSNLPPILAPYPNRIYTSENGKPPAPNPMSYAIKDSNGNWYLPPEIPQAWCDDDYNEHYSYSHEKSPTKPIIYVEPDFEFHSLFSKGLIS